MHTSIRNEIDFATWTFYQIGNAFLISYFLLTATAFKVAHLFHLHFPKTIVDFSALTTLESVGLTWDFQLLLTMSTIENIKILSLILVLLWFLLREIFLIVIN